LYINLHDYKNKKDNTREQKHYANAKSQPTFKIEILKPHGKFLTEGLKISV
jgi:hypothetical protein